MNPKQALILGISGQDGAYLAQLLLGEGYRVHGASRDAQVNVFANLERLGIRDRIELHSVMLTDFRSVLQVLDRIRPDEIYNLAGQTSVGLSFVQPVETLHSITHGTLNLLEAIRFMRLPIRFYNACSSECFGDVGEERANELTPFRPRSPYAVAKSAAFWEVANYREAYGLFACSGILSNHESPLRPERFVTQKIVASACRIAAGQQQRAELGNLSIIRDWGWAPEYVMAMHRMLLPDEPGDFVIATGQSVSLEDFVAHAFSCVGLNWKDHVDVSPGLFRPTDLAVSRLDPSKAERLLGWKATVGVRQVVERMVHAFQTQAGQRRPA